MNGQKHYDSVRRKLAEWFCLRLLSYTVWWLNGFGDRSGWENLLVEMLESKSFCLCYTRICKCMHLNVHWISTNEKTMWQNGCRSFIINWKVHCICIEIVCKCVYPKSMSHSNVSISPETCEFPLHWSPAVWPIWIQWEKQAIH